MNRHKRRWKNVADQALSPADFGLERERVALEIAACVAGRSAGDAYAIAALEGRVLGLIEDSWVRAALAAKHLDTLYYALRTADYEDQRSLEEEVSWTAAYFAPVLAGMPLQLNAEARTASEGDESAYLQRLFEALGERVAPRLRIAPAA